MLSTMKAVKLDASREANQRLQLENTLPIPWQPRSGHVTVKVCYAGVCGTDLQIRDGKFDAGQQVVLGHECCGVVVEKASNVSSLERGDRVVVNPQASCSTCRFCTRGRPHYCTSGGLRSTVGFHVDGGWAEYCEVPAQQAHKVPHGMPAHLAVLCEPFSCVLNGYRRLGSVPHDAEILVMGAGFVGIMWASLLHFYGYRHVTISEMAENRKQLANTLGFNYRVLTPGELSREFENRDAAEDGFDITIECTGVPSSITEAFPLLKRGGKLNIYGCHPKGEKLTIEPAEIMLKELTILGTLINPFTFPEATTLVQDMAETLTYERLGVEVYELDHYQEALDTLQGGHIVKAIFRVHGDW